MKHLTSIVFVFSLLTTLYSEKIDYYWRDYEGEIPDDALPAGSDRNHKATYVGQVYIAEHGLLPTRIYEGKQSVTASKNGIHTSDVFVKILCSNQSGKLSWIPTTAAKLHNDTAGKHVVIGGTEDEKVLNIGRVSFQGEVIVGKVCSYNTGSANLYFPYDGQEIGVASYEILIYEKTY
ncbi:uncharacterized protein LOC135131617 [Zophobas morio]|uniref:uncharacterized protein LOC135131617 n=1 Tax=Zophobas morio TaxID=2755281 RepID=UPI003083B337